MAVFLAWFWFGGVSMAENLVSIWETVYDSFSGAINSVAPNGNVTITLNSDVTFDDKIDIDDWKSVTIDLNWKTLTNLGSFHVLNGELELKGGSFNGEPIWIYWSNDSNSDSKFSYLKIADDVFIDTNWYAIVISNRGGTSNCFWVTVDVYWKLYDNIWVMWNILSWNSTLNFYWEIDSSGVWIAQNGYSIVNVFDWASIKAAKTAFEVRAWITNINWWVFESSWDPASVVGNWNWTTTVWAALAVSQHTTNLPISVNVKWWTFKAVNSLIITNPQENDILSDSSKVSVLINWWDFYWNVISENQKDWDDPVSHFINNWTFNKEINWEFITNDGINNVSVVLNDPVAQIWSIQYNTITGAIDIADDNSTVEILEAWEYTLSDISKPITIKWTVEWVAFTHSVSSSSNWKIAQVKWWTSFENVSFVLKWVKGEDYKHYIESDWKLSFKDCTIDGTLYVDSEMVFEDCDFVKKSASWNDSNSYNVQIYNTWIFTNVSFTNEYWRNVNLWDKWDNSVRHTVSFDWVKFKNTSDNTSKLPVMIHEARDYTVGNNKVSQWDVNFLNCTVEWNYNTTGFISDGNLFWIDDILTADWKKEDPLRGSVSSWTAKWWDVTVTVNWVKVYSTPKKNTTYNVTFDWTWKVVVNDWSKVSKPTDPTKNCNKFDGWYVWNDKYDFNAVVTSDLALISKWTYTCSSSSSSSGGGSGGWSSSSSSSKTTTTTNNTWSTNTWTNTTSNTEEINLGWEVTESTNSTSEETATPDNGYSKEFNDAYSWAFKNGITTMSPIEKADMNAPLTRIAMAKMLSQYAINVLGRTPDTTKVVPAFPDVSAELDAAYNSWVTLAYQLGIMWINIDKFRPDDLVTRAEFGTALSRMLYATADWEKAYYETHLAKLMEEKIITVDTPDLQELRGYVMIMLMRSANK